MKDLQAVGEAYQLLHPQKFYRRIWEHVRGGLPSSSLGADGGRSAEKPIPRLDSTDLNMLALRDRYKAHIASSFTLSRQGDFGKACAALEHARVIESGVLPELHMSTAELIDHVKRLRRRADEDEGQKHTVAEDCANCMRKVEKTKADRMFGGRCRACHEYKRDHDGLERPRALWERDVERELAG